MDQNYNEEKTGTLNGYNLEIFMSENINDNSELIQLLLDKCDWQYWEIQQLKSKFSLEIDIDAVKAHYEKTISTQQDRIVSLESMVA